MATTLAAGHFIFAACQPGTPGVGLAGRRSGRQSGGFLFGSGFYVEAPSLGLDGSGNGLGAAIDLGALARIGLPFDFVSTGLMLSNLGSFVPLHPGSPVRAMPTAVLAGGCSAAPAEDRFLTALCWGGQPSPRRLVRVSLAQDAKEPGSRVDDSRHPVTQDRLL